MSKFIPILVILTIFSTVSYCLAIEDSISNMQDGYQEPHSELNYEPGRLIILPDGRNALIEEILPDGNFRTDVGIIVSPQGVITEGEYKGQSVQIDQRIAEYRNSTVINKQDSQQSKTNIVTAPDNSKLITPEKKENYVGLPDKNKQNPRPDITAIPEKNKINDPIKPELKTPVVTPIEQKSLPDKTNVIVKPEITKQGTQTTIVEPSKTQVITPAELTLAQMLPLTAINPEKKEPKKAEKPNQTEKPESKKLEKPKQPEKQRKIEPAIKEDKKTPVTQPTPKPKNGEELRIPPEAIETGKMDFLEGCWQGTRPEYYSKRTIRECFCFGPNGKNGKRRIFDGHTRTCIGSTNASLSKNGVLSVTSSGAACSDGERWGQAEMVCRNSGQKTPCSWIFKDANNGQQAYTIPFVRVPSCGR